MPSPRPHSLQWWLSVVVIGVASSVFILVGFLSVVQVRREQRRAGETALRIVKATAVQLRATRDESRALLAQMTVRPGVMRLEPAVCHMELAAVDFLPRYADLFLFDESGRLVCSGNTDPRNVEISALARPWIERQLGEGRLHTGSMVMRDFGGRPMIMTTARASARSRTIVLLEYAEVLGRAAFIPGAVITIVDREGGVVARSHQSKEWSGRNLRGTAIAELRTQGEEGVAATRGLDGISRQYAFVHLRELGWTVYCGVPSWRLLGSAQEVVLTVLIGLLGSVLIGGCLILALARWIGRPIGILAAAATAAGDGVYAQVATGRGPREMSALAQAFNEMMARRKQSDERMRDDEKKMKALSERLLTVQEEERARIARELHDDLGQALTALKMDVVGLLQATDIPSELVPIRERVLHTLDSTVTSVQRISSELRPAILDDLGLVAAIEAEARLFEERSGIECEVSVAGDVPVDTDSGTAIYRIVQEALTNIIRHANATRTELRLRNRGDELLLEIRDDGSGVTTEEVDDPLSLGLIGIRERAALIGGSVRIEGVAGRGTIVSLRIPLAVEARLA